MSEPQSSSPETPASPSTSEALLGTAESRPRYTGGLRDDRESPGPPAKRRIAWRRGCRGCLVGLLVVTILVAIAAYFLFSRLQRIGAGVVGVTLVTAVTEMDLPDEHEEQLVARIEGVKAAYLAGEVSHERLVLLLTRLQRSPLILVTRLRRAELRYLPTSNLKAEEQKSGRLSLGRLIRGIEEGSITRRSAERVLHSLSQPDGRGQMRLKEKVSDADLRLALARAREEADAARVPEEPYEPHLADAFERLVDQVLGPVGRPEGTEATAPVDQAVPVAPRTPVPADPPSPAAQE